MKTSCFTLLEMIAAITLTAIITVALFSAFYIGFSSENRVKQYLPPLREASAALEYIRQDLVSAMPPTGILAGPFVGENADVAELTIGGEHNLVDFYTVNQDFFGGAHGIRRIEYVLLDQGRDRGVVLVRRITANLLASVTPESFEEVLCGEVLQCSMLFYDGNEWRDAWDSTARDNVLPSAVSVTIALRGVDENVDDDAGYRIIRTIILPAAWAQD